MATRSLMSLSSSRSTSGYSRVKSLEDIPEEIEYGYIMQPPGRERPSLDRKIWLLHGAICVIWIVMFVLPYAAPSLKVESILADVYRPVPDEVTEYSYQESPEDGLGMPSKYFGKPNRETEDYWDQILSLGYIDLKHDEVEKLTDQPVNDTANYVGSVGIFQQLQCLYTLHKLSYSPRSIRFTGDRIEDCTRIFSEAILCNGGLDVETHIFDPETRELDVGTAPSKVAKECRSLDKVVDWAEQRKSRYYWKHKATKSGGKGDEEDEEKEKQEEDDNEEKEEKEEKEEEEEDNEEKEKKEEEEEEEEDSEEKKEGDNEEKAELKKEEEEEEGEEEEEERKTTTKAKETTTTTTKKAKSDALKAKISQRSYRRAPRA